MHVAKQSKQCVGLLLGLSRTSNAHAGGLMSPNLSHAVEPFVTSVIVGKDAISRVCESFFLHCGLVVHQNLLPLKHQCKSCALSDMRHLAGHNFL